MIKEIKYGGFTASPSDYESPDGELAALIGLVPDEGNLIPIMPPNAVITLEGGNSMLFVHETSQFTHYIVGIFNEEEYSYEIWYIDKETNQKIRFVRYMYDDDIPKVNAIGNTLILMYAQNTVYYLWDSSRYKRLGEHLPEINLSFGLQGHPRLFSASDSSKSTFTISFAKIWASEFMHNIPDDKQGTITEQIFAKVNKFVAEQGVNKGRFVHPFFVRYALRLYDGSLVMHSAPILMNPCTTNNPIVYWTQAYSNDSVDEVDHAVCNMMLVACDLDYAMNDVTSDDFEQWKDIVKSVDVFISKPIYPYDINGKITKCSDSNDFDSIFVGKLVQNGSSGSISEDKYLGAIQDPDGCFDKYAQWTYQHIYGMYFNAKRKNPYTVFRLPEFSEEKVGESLRSNSQFYLLHSIDINDLKTDRTVIPIDKEYLQSLITREAMTDDYQTHDTIVPSTSFVYNNRVNYYGVRRRLFKGFHMSNMLALCNTRYSFELSGTTVNLSRPQSNWSHLTDRYSIVVKLKENGEDVIVSCGSQYDTVLSNFLSDEHTTNMNGQYVLSKENWGCYFFYPNQNAYEMIIVPDGNNTEQQGTSYVIKLKPHDFLNGAYALLDYNIVRQSSGPYNGNSVDSTYEIIVHNKIYTSEVNNPFYFPVLGINTVGTGTILGISTAAKALSQGQFGQFPLYAFTTEGVWAMEVSSTGLYSAKQPITRDVCINADSITQLDSAVLFATDRGIMLISGSNSQCISDPLDYPQVFSIDSLPEADKLVAMAGFEYEDFDYVPFRQFLLGCRMIYAYTQQRVIVYNPAHSYAYVYSLKSKTWGMMQSSVADNVASYPEALAMLKDGTLVDFCTDAPQQQDEDGHMQGIKGLLITRPLKLDAPDLLKTIDTAIQRGNFRKGSIKSALYGSRDLQSWSLIWTSQDHYLRGFRGTPYKYFRFAILCDMQPDESLFGVTIQYTPRLINQPR